MNFENIYHHIKERKITEHETMRKYYIDLHEAFLRSEKELDRQRNNMIALLETLDPLDGDWRKTAMKEWTQGDFIRFAEIIKWALLFFKTGEKADALDWAKRRVHAEKCKVYNYKKEYEAKKRELDV